VCRCDCRYVGRTSLRLQDRIIQHISKSTCNNQKPTKILLKRNCKEKINTTKLPQCDSAIGLHLFQNKQCANNYNYQQFSFLARARSAFYLLALETTFIKTLKLILCRQKEFVYSFTNFPIVSVSQHNANSIVIFRHIISINTPAFLSISLRFDDCQASQPISCLDDFIQTTTFILAFYSSDDS